MTKSANSFTIQDVAASASVSIATVSRVLNDSAGVAQPTRDAVLAAIERTGFVPRRRRRSGSARPLPLLQGVIAVRCPYTLTHHFGPILSAIAAAAAPHGKRLLLSSESADGNESSLSALLFSQATEGAILILPPEQPEMLAGLQRDGYPFVVIDPRTPVPADVAMVSAAHAHGARAVTEHLLGLGHRRIGVIAGPDGWVATDARLAGHHAALAAVELTSSAELIASVTEPDTSHGFEAALALLSLPRRPTAIAAFNDMIALGCLEAAKSLGLRVPQDVSIAGFDDLDLTRVTVPRLTTVRQPVEAMGTRGMTLLLQRIVGHPIRTLHVELPTELIVRESTAPPQFLGR